MTPKLRPLVLTSEEGGMQGYFEQLSPLLSRAPKEAEIARVLAQYSAEVTGPPLTA
jgi:hypothetical protein